MTDFASHTAAVRSRASEGIGCIVLGTMMFVGQDGLMKSLLNVYPIWTLIAVRGVVAIVILAPVIVYLGGPYRLFTPLWPLHLLRATLFAAGFTLFYTAFPFMGLAEISTIFFSAPLMIALLAVLWLRETIGPHRIGALVVGFVGVIIAMNPTGETFRWVAVLPLLCAMCYAMAQILARKIGDRETTLTTGLYTVALAGFLIVPAGWAVNQVVSIGPDFHHLRWDWTLAKQSDIYVIVLLGGIGMAGFVLLTRAYQVASASLVAPFDYTYLPFATLLAYAIWDETPQPATLAGMALIIASGLYLGYRELRSNRPRIEPLPVAEAAIAPGNPTAPLSLAADIEDDGWITEPD